MRKIFTLLLLAVAVLMPGMANAKWSKACAKFDYGGISVEVIDRHEEVGRMYDTYGYTIFKNSIDEKVKVEWKGYGILKKTHKLVLLTEGEFTLNPKQERKEVYNYGAGRFTEKDFESYVIAINPTKLKTKEEKVDEESGSGSGASEDSKPAKKKGKKGSKDSDDESSQPYNKAPETTKSFYSGSVNADNADEVYERFMSRHKAGKLTEQDYIDAGEWLDYMWNNKVQPLMQQMIALRQHNENAKGKQLVDANEGMMTQWSSLGEVVNKAYKENKLPEKTKDIFEKIKKEFNSYPI